MDPLGNQVRSTDEYGNPIPSHGSAGYVDHHNTDGYGQQLHGGGVTPGVLRRSGSSSSSSSEDDGLGGRRKKNKGIKDKIKEKLPGAGGHKDDNHPQQHYEQGVAAGEKTHENEKKGIMEKIKEKIPGSHGH